MVSVATSEAVVETLHATLQELFPLHGTDALRGYARKLTDDALDIISNAEELGLDPHAGKVVKTRTDRKVFTYELGDLGALQAWLVDGWTVEQMATFQRDLIGGYPVPAIVVILAREVVDLEDEPDLVPVNP
jgi:hypothetical protein